MLSANLPEYKYWFTTHCCVCSYPLSHIEDYLEEDLDNKQADMAVNNSPVRSRKVKKSRFYKCLLDRSIRAKKKGARQARRVENSECSSYAI